MNGLIKCFSNDREYVPGCEGIPLSLQAPHLPTIALITLPNPSLSWPYFYTVAARNISASGEHITSDAVARSFVVLCAPQAAKRTNQLPHHFWRQCILNGLHSGGDNSEWKIVTLLSIYRANKERTGLGNLGPIWRRAAFIRNSAISVVVKLGLLYKGKQLKTLIPEWSTPFCTQFICAVCKYRCEQCLVLIECTIELNLNMFIFLTTKSDKESIYCERKGRIFNFLNCSQQDSLCLAFNIILITLFCNLKIKLL